MYGHNYLLIMKDDRTSTTVKFDPELYCDFRVAIVRRRLTLQKFVNRCAHLYIENEDFRKMVDNFVPTQLSTTASFSINIFTGSCSDHES